MILDLTNGWENHLASEATQPYFLRLRDFVDAERQEHSVYPAEDDVFRALRETSPGQIRVVIVGQDPYHEEGQAHGLAFSVRPGTKIPPSLKNIFKELAAEFPNFPAPSDGCLTPWARQGVLLLNTVLTVRAHAANSHKGKGWEFFTDAVLRTVNLSESPVVFVLWGDHAQKKAPMIDTSRHRIVQSAHPSPLSAYRGFLGSRPFHQINQQLEAWGHEPIDWRL